MPRAQRVWTAALSATSVGKPPVRKGTIKPIGEGDRSAGRDECEPPGRPGMRSGAVQNHQATARNRRRHRDVGRPPWSAGHSAGCGCRSTTAPGRAPCRVRPDSAGTDSPASACAWNSGHPAIANQNHSPRSREPAFGQQVLTSAACGAESRRFPPRPRDSHRMSREPASARTRPAPPAMRGSRCERKPGIGWSFVSSLN